MEQTKFWQGTNFWVAAIMGTAGLLFGFSEEQTSQLVSWVFAGIGGAFAIREGVKSVHIDAWTWIKSKNTWNYLVAAIAYAIPSIPAGLGEKVSDIIGAVSVKNWGAAISGVVSILTALFFIFIKKPTPITNPTKA